MTLGPDEVLPTGNMFQGLVDNDSQCDQHHNKIQQVRHTSTGPGKIYKKTFIRNSCFLLFFFLGGGGCGVLGVGGITAQRNTVSSQKVTEAKQNLILFLGAEYLSQERIV